MQRRKFIYNFLWLTGGLIAGCNKNFKLLKASGKNARGRVTGNGKGLADVVISDGYSVVKTARDGSYELALTTKSEHVFISVPSGYKIPHEKNIARHYKTIRNAGNWNFELKKLEVNDEQHQFMIWADPQVKNQKDVAKLMSESVPDVQQYMQSLPANTLIHGICVGDIVWDNQPLFGSYNAAVEMCGLPFFQVIGNHDMDYRKGGEETSDDTFRKTYGPTYYSFNRGQVHYVVLDDVWYTGPDRQYKGLIHEDQLAWLKKDLEFVPKDKLVVLSAHIPVNNVENKDDLYEIVKGYNVHIMTGHTHYNNNIIKDNVYEHIHGTVCGAWWTGPICGDGTPPGYAIYEVNGNKLKWFYKSVGKKKDHQIRTMFESKENGEKELIANVWNWDPAWKVEWHVDGTSMGNMPRMSAYDPLAVTLYKGTTLPASRPFVEPKLTEHMFKAIVPKGAKEIRIVATDRFGSTYETIA